MEVDAGLKKKQPSRIRWSRMLIVGCVLIILYLAGQILGSAIIDGFDLHLRVQNEPMIHRLIMTSMSLYLFLMAIPFMPGVEVGLSMILFFGSDVCLLVYLTTVTALTISYFMGRFVPVRYCMHAFSFFGLHRAEELVRHLAPLDTDERLSLLLQNAPSGIVPVLLRHRYLALAVLFNLPGNMLIGGGGGIALIAGMSGLYRSTNYFITVTLAVAPVPLIISFTEMGFLS